MTRNEQIRLQHAFALANLALLNLSPNPSDMLFGRQARQGVRHALPALVLAKGRKCQPDWSTGRLITEANPGMDLNIGAGLLDQYPEPGSASRSGAEHLLTQIPDHRFMIIADIRMLLELAENQPAERSASQGVHSKWQL